MVYCVVVAGRCGVDREDGGSAAGDIRFVNWPLGEASSLKLMTETH